MPHISKSSHLSLPGQPPHPCSLPDGHTYLRKYFGSNNPFFPRGYRKTCTKCGEWEERDGEGTLLLTSRDQSAI